MHDQHARLFKKIAQSLLEHLCRVIRANNGQIRISRVNMIK